MQDFDFHPIADDALDQIAGAGPTMTVTPVFRSPFPGTGTRWADPNPCPIQPAPPSATA